MDTQTVEILCKINNEFYREQCASFSSTRQSAWPGWERCLEVIGLDMLGGREEFSVFDLACGNLRFEKFLASRFPQATISYYAVDNCDDLVPQAFPVSYQSLDVVDALRTGLPLSEELEAPACDLSASFGFMHHIPTQEYREKVLRALIEQTLPGGYILISFWQFLNSTELREKAQTTHKRAVEALDLTGLDENDYLLGWKNTPGVYRYCHSFSEAEIDELVDRIASETKVVSRFACDGRTEDMNTYLVLEKPALRNN